MAKAEHHTNTDMSITTLTQARKSSVDYLHENKIDFYCILYGKNDLI